MAKKVRVIKASNPGSWYADRIGEIFEVADKARKLGGGETYVTLSSYGGIRVVDTSPIHEIDGVLYQEVERRAEVGEKVVATNSQTFDEYEVGAILHVLKSDRWGCGKGISAAERMEYDVYWADGHALNHDEYRVLVPVTPESDADIIANLTRRVFALENARTSDGAILIEAFTEMLRKRDERIDALEERLDEAKVTI